MAGFADRVQDSSSTTGTGDLTLDGTPPSGFIAFGTAFAVGSWVYYAATDTSNNWEVGFAPLSGSTTLARSAGRVYSSSNSGALASFSATITVFGDIPATFMNRAVTRGRDTVMTHSLP